jgi:hypothetical protein
VWSDGNFDKDIWNILVSQVDSVDCHFSLEPNQDGTTTLPPDFVPFSLDIENDQDQDQQFRNNNTIRDKTNTNINSNNAKPTVLLTDDGETSSPLLSRRIFNPSPSPQATINIPAPPPIESQPRRSTRFNIGNAPERLDPSNHLATNYTESSTTFPSEQYCNALGIKLPSASRGRTNSQGGCSKTSYTQEK